MKPHTLGATLALSFVLAFHACTALAATADPAPAAAAAVAQPAPASCAEHYDVVVGVSDKEKLELAINNSLNLQSELGAACVNVEVVVNSAAVTLLGPMSPQATRIKEALKAGLKIVACENSMGKFKMTADDLFPGITTVPAGVAEIVKREKQGWLYLRP